MYVSRDWESGSDMQQSSTGLRNQSLRGNTLTTQLSMAPKCVKSIHIFNTDTSVFNCWLTVDCVIKLYLIKINNPTSANENLSLYRIFFSVQRIFIKACSDLYGDWLLVWLIFVPSDFCYSSPRMYMCFRRSKSSNVFWMCPGLRV